MNFLNAPGFEIFYFIVLGIIFIALMIWLVKSAMNSLKRTGGKWNSVVDEVVIGVIVLAAFIIIGQMDPASVINFLIKPLKWLWGILLDLLRFVGVQV